jgi:serine/threonine protein kinase
MGDVFLAAVKGLEGFNKLVVIKRLRETLAEDGEMRMLFLAEGRLAARLNHPNVVQTNEVGEEQGSLYLSMEYLEGQPLSEINRKVGTKPLDPVLAARIVSDALAGLHYAHELRDYDGTPLHFVHRDVSPQNVFITYEGVTKVVDFGVAKVAWQVGSKTQNGVLKGKVAYMAPEQVSGTPDRRADIYSMGVLLWELIARRRLIANTSVAQALHRVMNDRPPRVSDVVLGVHPRLDDIIAKALEKDPADRFQTAQEMRDELDAYVAQSGRFVRQEDVAELLQSLFKNRRERVRRQVQTSMQAANETSSLTQLPGLSGRREAGASSVSRGGSSSGATASPLPGAHTLNRELGPAPPPYAHQRTFRYIAGGVVIALLGAVSLLAGMKTRRAEAPSTLASESVPKVAGEPSRAAPAPAPATVQVAAPKAEDTFETVATEPAPSKKSRRLPHWSPRAVVAAPGPSAPAGPNSALGTATPQSPEAAAQAPRKRKFRTEF